MKINYEFSMNNYIQEKLKIGLFCISDIITVLIETLKYISWKEPSSHNSTKLKIVINKMNRVFYIFDKKFFSIGLPFQVTIGDAGCIIKDLKTNIIIDNKLLSLVEAFFRKYNPIYESDIVSIFEQFFEETPELSKDEKYRIRIISLRLLSFEYGYIRYEDDIERENGLKHPRYHFDINYQDGCKYKIGLDKSIDDNWFCDCLDITKECKVIKV